MTEANPIVTLKAKIKEFGFNKLRAKDNKSANSGEQAYKDINRMDFIINGENIDRDFVDRLYKNILAWLKIIKMEKRIIVHLQKRFLRRCFNILEQKLQMIIF